MQTNHRDLQTNAPRKRQRRGTHPCPRRKTDQQTVHQCLRVSFKPFSVVYRLCLTKEKEENRVIMVYKDYKDLLKSALLDMAPLLNEEKDVYKLGVLRKIW